MPGHVEALGRRLRCRVVHVGGAEPARGVATRRDRVADNHLAGTESAGPHGHREPDAPAADHQDVVTGVDTADDHGV
jgi:hypothetical protein